MESLDSFATAQGMDPTDKNTLAAYNEALTKERIRLAEGQGVTVEALHTGQAAVVAATTSENSDKYVPAWHPV